MDRKTREELNSLSKQVFGTTSRWQKIVNNGVAEPMSREREVMVPSKNGRGVEKKTFTDKKSVVRRYSVDEVRKLMEELLEERKKRVIETKNSLGKTTEVSASVLGSQFKEGMTVKTDDGQEATVVG